MNRDERFDEMLRQAFSLFEEEELAGLELAAKNIDIGQSFRQKIWQLIHSNDHQIQGEYADSAESHAHVKKDAQQEQAFARKKIIFRVLHQAVVLLLVALLSMGALYITSPRARAYMDTIIQRIYKDHNTYRFSTEEVSVHEGDYSLGYIPEDFVLEDEMHGHSMHILFYRGKDDRRLSFSYQSACSGTWAIDNERMTHQDIEIQGKKGVLAYSEEENFALAFILDKGILLGVDGDFSAEEALYILEHVQAHK